MFRDSDVFFPDETSRPPDGIATGQITSFEDDITYWVGAEAPAGNAEQSDAPIGSVSKLRLTQSFIKRSDDASLSITVSAAFIETTDLNASLARVCPPGHRYDLLCDLIKGELFVNVAAFTVPPPPDVVVVGSTGPLGVDFAVARLLPDGTLDTGFTDTGVLRVDFSRSTDIAENVAVTSDGKIVVSGQARGSQDGYGVVRLAPVVPSS